jgi:hypothetical protein
VVLDPAVKLAALILGLLVLAGLAWIRLAPNDPARWHVDPAAASDPGRKGVKLRHDMTLPPDQALAAFDAVARRHPRTRPLAGSVAQGHVTYVVRSLVFGFPDYVSARAEPAGDGAVLHILSRLRFGGSDMGVNGARMAAWLAVLPSD